LKRYLRPTVHKVVLVVQVKAVLVDLVDRVDLEVPMFNNKKKS
jgi:hypothetical protein